LEKIWVLLGAKFGKSIYRLLEKALIIMTSCIVCGRVALHSCAIKEMSISICGDHLDGDLAYDHVLA